LDIPHFGRGHDVNNCTNQLMDVTHGGYLWVEEPILIVVELISYITGLPFQGESHTQFLYYKTKEKALAREMKKTYGTYKGSCIIIIKHISDTTTRLAKKFMVSKFLSKCWKEEVPTGVVASTT
jgi:hypothetical protein